MNADLLRKSLHRHECVTIALLAEESGLSAATCKNILREMLESGEVRETDQADSSGGRPSRQYQYNRDFAHGLILYLRKEGTRNLLFFEVFDAVGISVITETKELPGISLSDIEEVISTAVTQFPPIRVITLGINGIVHQGRIVTCDIPTMETFDIGSYLSEKYSIPVVVENDMNATAVGYYDSLNSDERSFIYIYFPEGGGAGAGIVLNGELLRGSSGLAGEISSLPGLKAIDQAAAQEDEDAFCDLVIHMIRSAECLINPASIVLSGSVCTDAMKSAILSRINKETELNGFPDILFEEDIHESFVAGLKYLAMEQLTCGYKIVGRG